MIIEKILYLPRNNIMATETYELKEIRCEKERCQKLLMKVLQFKGYAEIKCKCGHTNVITGSINEKQQQPSVQANTVLRRYEG